MENVFAWFRCSIEYVSVSVHKRLFVDIECTVFKYAEGIVSSSLFFRLDDDLRSIIFCEVLIID